jgi:hypothetical protein
VSGSPIGENQNRTHERTAVLYSHATDSRDSRLIGTPSVRTELAGKRPATAFDDGQG